MNWEKLSFDHSIPCARGFHSIVNRELQRELILFGGTNNEHSFNDLWRFNYEFLRWEKIKVESKEKPSPRHSCTGVLVNDDEKLLIFGGFTGHYSGPLNDIWIFDFESNKWEEMIQKNTVSGQKDHTTCVLGNRVYTLGGAQNNAFMRDLTNKFQCFDITTKKWTELPSFPFNIRWHTMVAHKNQLIVFGGYVNSQYSNQTWSFDIKLNQWIEIKPSESFIPETREGHTAAMGLASDAQDNIMFVFGGHKYDLSTSTRFYLMELLALDLESKAWIRIKESGDISGRKAQSLNIVKNSRGSFIIVFGGRYRDPQLDFHYFDEFYMMQLQFSASLLHLYARKELCDLEIKSKNGVLLAHQLVLKLRLRENYSTFLIRCLGETWQNVDIQLKNIYGRYSSSIPKVFDNIPLKNFQDDMLVLFRDFEDSKDFTIVVQKSEKEKKIRVHKLILAAKSDLFRGMFLSVVDDDSNTAPDFSGRSYKAVKTLVRFLYFETLPSSTDPIVAAELIDASSYYMLSSSFLNILCYQIIHENLNLQNVIQIFSIISKKLYVDEAYLIRDECLNVFQKHFRVINKEFQDLLNINEAIEVIQSLILSQSQLNTLLKSCDSIKDDNFREEIKKEVEKLIEKSRLHSTKIESQPQTESDNSKKKKKEKKKKKKFFFF
ncbi:kelch repeat protein [Anaeramoeba ignava]|uniref:Kelch repeat protein n=1 Tax=Anaeramoeba ignava TaxID=1746090 RepID=A0A9Q0LX84_ANAIG|nr:kelch repeat protein [Anaeramoeba ignava]